jgi:hypothetical protein
MENAVNKKGLVIFSALMLITFRGARARADYQFRIPNADMKPTSR